MSHPSWVRGLKRNNRTNQTKARKVAPLVGAWIETASYILVLQVISVAPLVGAWIETSKARISRQTLVVAPLVGAWIETIYKLCFAENK